MKISNMNMVAEALLKGYLARENADAEFTVGRFGSIKMSYAKSGKEYEVFISCMIDDRWKDGDKQGQFCLLPRESRLINSDDNVWIVKICCDMKRFMYASNKTLKKAKVRTYKGQKHRNALYFVDSSLFKLVEML